MGIDRETSLIILIVWLAMVAIAFIAYMLVEEYKEKQEEKRYEEAKKAFRKTLIEMCDTTIEFNKSLASAIDQHAYYANKGDELIEKIVNKNGK